VAHGEITVGELLALGASARVIDVREPDEWADGHIPWAIHVPLGTVPDQLDRFDGSPTYVVCRSGGRSGRACEFAADHGLDTTNVVGGMLAWAEAGLPIERDDDTDG
jgi:rhodanese-related sulfurtransferase